MMLVLCCLPTLCQPPQDPSVVLELGKLKGTWQVASLNIDGMDQTTTFKDIRFVFSGQLMTLTDKSGKALRRKDGKVEERAFKLNVDKQPKEIDLTISEKFQSLGIYMVESDTLTLCTAEPGLARPAEFKGGKGASLVRLKRQIK